LVLRTCVSGPQREVSGPGSQDLGFRPSTRGFRTWGSGPRYLALRTWVSGPRKLSILRSSYLFPITFLCVHRHFSLHPVVTDGQTNVVNLYIRLVSDCKTVYKICFLSFINLKDAPFWPLELFVKSCG